MKYLRRYKESKFKEMYKIKRINGMKTPNQYFHKSEKKSNINNIWYSYCLIFLILGYLLVDIFVTNILYFFPYMTHLHFV